MIQVSVVPVDMNMGFDKISEVINNIIYKLQNAKNEVINIDIKPVTVEGKEYLNHYLVTLIYKVNSTFDIKPSVKRCAVRTRPYNVYNTNATSILNEKLSEGWYVVLANKVGDELEYILEKEEV